MPEERVAAGLLLVLGPVLGLLPVGYPPLLGIWRADRATHRATVAAHRRAWAMLNAGFGVATIATATGLGLLRAGAAMPLASVGLEAVTVAYVMGGVLWLAFLAMRTRTTPLLAADAGVDRLAAADDLLGAATGGLFAAYTVVTAVALIGLGAVITLGSSPAGAATGLVAGIVAAVALVGQLRTGDSIPAVLYLSTIVVGVAVLAGWV